MNTHTTSLENDPDDAMYELSIDVRPLTAAVVEEFVRRYPTHAMALTDFAINLALERMHASVTSNESRIDASREDSLAVSKAISAFHNRIHALKTAKATAEKTASSAQPVNPFAGLTPEQYKQLIAGQQLTALFVNKFRDRRVDADTVPNAFMEDFSKALNVDVSVLSAHLHAPQMVSAGQHFSSEVKPQAGKRQTFADAVETSNLPEDAKKRLLSL